MPLNKNAAYRYRIIDACLRQRPIAIKELIVVIAEKLYEEFDIDSGLSERQLLEDIKIMRKDAPEGYGAPIKRHLGVLSYTDSSFTIQSSPLIKKDLDALKEAVGVLKQLSDFPHFHELKNIYDKLSGAVTLGRFEEENPIVQFDKTTLVQGTEFIKPIYDYIKNKKVLNIGYQPFEQAYLVIILHPCFLKEYNNRWFAVGFSPLFDKVINIAIDRIQSIEEQDSAFVNPSKNLSLMYKNLIGITLPHGQKMEEVILQFSRQRLPYILTKPLHPSQNLISTDERGYGTLSYQLIPNFELSAVILSHGAAVTVLSPESLVDKIRTEIKKMREIY